MAIRFPRVMQAKTILRKSNLFSNIAGSESSNVPKGYLAVYAGEIERTRFVVPISFLNEPSFQELLCKSEEEFGFQHPMGGLTIPCSQDIFINMTSHLNVF
ncbi:auxin-responsive protein SAUR21-like [Rutidosis leptorrhynchoides]|uniref:auxin-responsive protein SAUR21-like n=1 Tax=Rutidosis leptorrhynchoides TaxID=125765 RepID=UPI003A995FB8